MCFRRQCIHQENREGVAQPHGNRHRAGDTEPLLGQHMKKETYDARRYCVRFRLDKNA